MSLDLLRTIEELPVPDLLVVGDVMLDRYVTGPVERISAEAPIQILRESGARLSPGGMAAVALTLVRLGARVRVAGLVGDDQEGAALRQQLEEAGVHADGILCDPSRPTTTKTRFVAKSGHSRQQILRVDRESSNPPGAEAAAELMATVRSALPDVDALLLSDYGKGVLRGDFCREVIAAGRSAGVKVIVDPKGADFDRYRGATAVTPNRAEASAATGHGIAGYEDADAVAGALLERLDLDVVYITLDKDGIYVRERDGSGSAIHTDPREVFDVTGAGDNVIAVLGYATAGGVGPVTAAALANVAGGIAVEHFGVVTVGWDEIAARIAAGTGGDTKLVDEGVLLRLLDSARAADRRVVFTNGCFDILHPGHIDLLQRSRALGDLLVVGLNDDASVRRLKGESRPVNDLRSRATVLGGLSVVDYMVAFGEDTPERIIRLVRPDVLVKGADWSEKGVVGREFVESYGGRVELLPLVAGHSTSSVIRKIEGAEDV
jgi:D-beta-D-heptose 7-phosphate kinase/D-beta-D-heptose 1-phosphate adenosyltransferase